MPGSPRRDDGQEPVPVGRAVLCPPSARTERRALPRQALRQTLIRRFQFGAWELELLWSLAFGAWMLVPSVYFLPIIAVVIRAVNLPCCNCCSMNSLNEAACSGVSTVWARCQMRPFNCSISAL